MRDLKTSSYACAGSAQLNYIKISVSLLLSRFSVSYLLPIGL